MYYTGDDRKFWKTCTGCDTEIWDEEDAHIIGDGDAYCSVKCSVQTAFIVKERRRGLQTNSD
jgi:hypothetical protein